MGNIVWVLAELKYKKSVYYVVDVNPITLVLVVTFSINGSMGLCL